LEKQTTFTRLLTMEKNLADHDNVNTSRSNEMERLEEEKNKKETYKNQLTIKLKYTRRV